MVLLQATFFHALLLCLKCEVYWFQIAVGSFQKIASDWGE